MKISTRKSQLTTDPTPFEVDGDGEFSAILRPLSEHERRRWLSRLFASFPAMDPRWYAGFEQLVSDLNDADLSAQCGPIAKREAAALFARLGV